MKARSDRHRRTLCASAAVAAVVLLAAAGCTGGPSGAASSPPTETSKRETSEGPPQRAEADEPALDGVAFTDPGGHYTLTVSPDWEPRHGIVSEGIEVWLVAEAEGNSVPTVNVVTENVTGMSLGDYVELSISSAPNLIAGFELLSRHLVTGSAGQELAVLEYSGADLEYLVVIAMGPDGAVLVTLAAPPDRFARIRGTAYPYMLTLQPT